MRPWFAPPIQPKAAPAPVEVDPAALAQAWRDEVAARRRYWLAGVPTKGDLTAVTKHIAGRFKVPVEAVVNAVSKEA